ncbi:MAG: bifunctional phosphopantothenoylcysteine decarboxylase/phosphopantothenate--cysteine ligase CoaBC, partial [Campylobacter sp.]|nr:bifunctional phosphopantothenoylcysteine decarboxylase/phosphopantothenate--cysteine ligase CoaBC [Campylobacter sp.]
KMLLNKDLDAVCLNVLTEKNNFGSDENEINFITKNGEIKLATAQKSKIAEQIVRLASKL